LCAMGYVAGFKSCDTFRRNLICAESYQRVFRTRLFEGVIESKEATEVFGVGDECGPRLLRRLRWAS